jgi:DNA-binding ferritin-like protein
MKKNLKYTEEQAQAVVGDLWYNKLKPYKKTKIKKEVYDKNKDKLVANVVTKLAKTESSDLDEFYQALLGHLTYLDIWYHSCHWLSKGSSYYGDHLLFQRLYEALGPEIDLVGEKGVFSASEASVDRLAVIEYIVDKESEVKKMMDAGDDMLDVSILLEEEILGLIEESLDDVSPGSQNMLEGIADVHETHIYLLNQRKKETISKLAKPEAPHKDFTVLKKFVDEHITERKKLNETVEEFLTAFKDQTLPKHMDSLKELFSPHEPEKMIEYHFKKLEKNYPKGSAVANKINETIHFFEDPLDWAGTSADHKRREKALSKIPVGLLRRFMLAYPKKSEPLKEEGLKKLMDFNQKHMKKEWREEYMMAVPNTLRIEDRLEKLVSFYENKLKNLD